MKGIVMPVRNLLVVLISGVLIISCSKTSNWQPAEIPLKTRWTDDVSPENVWPEYPRPIMERKDWKNLNGLWEYAIRSIDSPKPVQFDGQILVPFPVESSLSGVGKWVGPENVLWYRTKLDIPSDWTRQRILLHFESVDWETTVWFNGEKLGNHKGGYDPFYFDISNHIKIPGDQSLVVSVWDPSDKGSQPRGKQNSEPGGIFYTPSTGIWQTVWLEPVPETSIRDFQVFPDIDQEKITVKVFNDNPNENDWIRITASDKNKNDVAVAVGKNNDVIELNIDNPILWSPDTPYLYDLTIQLIRNEQTIDEVSSYFGMRKTSIGKDEAGITRLMLNNQFVFQIGPLDQGFFPDGLHTPPTEEAMKYDLEVTKNTGFNMLRKHVKIESRRFYTLCDQMGLLVWQDMPNGDQPIQPYDPDLKRTAESAQQFEMELKQLVTTKFNHPSIIMWVPFNEGWGQYDTPRIAELIRSLDPTRLVNSASGWSDRGVGDVVDVHRYPGPGAPDPEEDRAAVVGEFGGLGLNIKGHMWQKEGWGYELFQDSEALTIKYEEIIQRMHELVKNPGLSAAVYTQTTDIETENNGLITYDREIIKIDPETLKMANTGFLPPVMVKDARVFIDQFLVAFQSTSETAQIVYTMDGSEPTQNSNRYTKPFMISESATIKARCFWEDGKKSRIKSFLLDKVDPQKSVASTGLSQGLRTVYYEGRWMQLPDFSDILPIFTKTAEKINLELSPKVRYYALKLEGFIKVPRTGVYVFYVMSDDGSRLFINDEQIVNNDGKHGTLEKHGSVALEKGFHHIRLIFYQRYNEQFLSAFYKGPGIEKQEIPSEVLFHK
jgi:hypothetical protein